MRNPQCATGAVEHPGEVRFTAAGQIDHPVCDRAGAEARDSDRKVFRVGTMQRPGVIGALPIDDGVHADDSFDRAE